MKTQVPYFFQFKSKSYVGISEGRGTTRPFELIGDPCTSDPVQANQLYQYLQAQTEEYGGPLVGVIFRYNFFLMLFEFSRTAFFVPTFDDFTNIACGGIQTRKCSLKALINVYQI